MPFDVTSGVTEGVARITLSGELDAGSASRFKQSIESVLPASPKRLVLFTKDLTFMASAGLRVLIFARQKLGDDVTIVVVAPQESILDTLQKTGFHHSVQVVASYPD